MRRSAVLTIFVLLLAACAEDPAPGPAAGDPEPQVDETRLGIYESTARELVGTENDRMEEDRDRLEALRRTPAERKCRRGCDDELSAAEQDELALRLADLGAPITFVEDPTPLYDEEWMTGAPETIVLRLGDDRGERLTASRSAEASDAVALLR